MRHPYRIALILALWLVAGTWFGGGLGSGAGSADSVAVGSGTGSVSGAPVPAPTSTPAAGPGGQTPNHSSFPPAAMGQMSDFGEATEKQAAAESSPRTDGDAADDTEPPQIVQSLHLLAAERVGPGALQLADGLDLAGPRDLVLWRIDPESGRAAVLAESRSGDDGRFQFDRLLLPDSGATLVVTPLGADPNGPTASLSLDSTQRIPPPPPAWVVGRRSGAVDVRVVPGPGATVWVSPEREIAAQPVVFEGPGRSRRTGRLIRLPELENGEGWVVAQSLPDGRRSEWRPVARPNARRNQTHNEGDGI